MTSGAREEGDLIDQPTAVVCGPPGADAAATGRALASALSVPFHDTDDAIERRTGRTVGDILVADGERAFRDLERAEVLRALAQERGIVSLGSGAVLDEEVQHALSGATVVFLDVRIADAARRIGLDGPRPLVGVNPRAAWTQMMDARRPVYERVSSLRVDTSGKRPEQVAEEVARALGAEGQP